MKKEKKREKNKWSYHPSIGVLAHIKSKKQCQDMLTSCSALSTHWFSWASPPGGISDLVATQDLGQQLQGNCGALLPVHQGIVATVGWELQGQGGRVCLAGHCLTRARFAPFSYTHAPEMFQASSHSTLSQYNRKMPVQEIPSWDQGPKLAEIQAYRKTSQITWIGC